MNELVDMLNMRIYSHKLSEAHELKICICCRKSIKDKIDNDEDRAGYELTGLCPSCYNSEF